MLKTVIKYITIIILLLLSIWSQCIVFFCFLIIVSLYFWKPSVFSFYQTLTNKTSTLIKKLIEWLGAAIFALFAIWFISNYILNFYTIKASSMLPSFSNNELIVINKLAYGPAVNINHSKKYRRLVGYSTPQQGDAIALFFPEADTSFVEHLDQDYHFIKRQFEHTHNYNPLLDSEVKYNPVNHRPVFIKRLIGLPGDTLQIKNGDYFINNTICELNSYSINRFEIKKTTPNQFKNALIKEATSSYRENGNQIVELEVSKIEQNNWQQYLNPIEEVMNMPNTYVFPFKANYLWNASWLGPVIIPTKGKTVRLTLTNLSLYKRIIESYEENRLSIIDNEIFINNKKTTEYTFKMNYYWVGGDNKKHSFDSRYWGFVPENHIIGRVEKLTSSKQ